LAGPLLLLTLTTSQVAAAARGQADQQHIPRQIPNTTAAIQGIARTEAGLGLGGVKVLLQDLSNGKTRTANSPRTTTEAAIFMQRHAMRWKWIAWIATEQYPRKPA
jgi:hypothetical protein